MNLRTPVARLHLHLARPLCMALASLALLGACRGPGETGEPPAVLTGQAFHLERIALPPEAELRVRLLQPAAPGGRSSLAAEQHRTEIGQSPFPFELGYDPRRLAPGRVHRLEAEVVVGGEVWFRGARSVSGLHAGPPAEPLELRLLRTSGAAAGPADPE